MTKNKNTEPSPFHKGAEKKGSSPLKRKKGKNEGEHRENMWGRAFGGSLGKWGEDEWGIKAGQAKVNKAFGEFGNIDTSANLFEGAKNLVNIRDNYSNTMEDLTVNQQQFQLQKEMSQQGAANAMDTFRGAAGGSGAAGLAQAMANQQAQSAQQISASVGQQESAGKSNSSDRRLKKNITKIGESNRGFNIYSFEYKDSLDGEGLFQGVMSDEIPQEAVTSVDGYDRVNYSMLDVEFKQI